MPDAVVTAYGSDPIQFGPEYIIPKPLDPRVLFQVAPAVASAAIESGATRRELDMERYVERLEARLGKSREMMRVIYNKAKTDPKQVVLADGENDRTIRAAHQLIEEGIAHPILLGDPDTIERSIHRLGLSLEPDIVDPTARDIDRYTEYLYQRRKRRGVTKREARELIQDPNYYASIMVDCGEADAMLTGLTHHYPSALRPLLQIIGTADDAEYAAGVYMLTFRNRVIFCADATVNQAPDEDILAEVTRHTAELARRFNVAPRAAILSYSNFGSVRNEGTAKPRRAAKMLREDQSVEFPVDGEMQADTAVVKEFLQGTYEFSELDDPANVLIFPNLEAGNISYKLLQRLGGAEAIGPMLVGMAKPVHVLQRDDEVKDIVNLTAVAVVDAQRRDSESLENYT